MSYCNVSKRGRTGIEVEKKGEERRGSRRGEGIQGCVQV